jgi:hypothetical protein
MQTKSFRQVESEAAADVLRAKMQGGKSAPLYVPGSEAKPTRERAIAQALEEDPEVYAQYRAQHNARPLVQALEAAGIKLGR